MIESILCYRSEIRTFNVKIKKILYTGRNYLETQFLTTEKNSEVDWAPFKNDRKAMT